jgi:hypothetical protein
MARINFRFRRWVSGLTLFTYVIPSSFLSIPFFRMMADYDLIDTKLGLQAVSGQRARLGGRLGDLRPASRPLESGARPA